VIKKSVGSVWKY